jgi:D-3-phosphoglycerate dehydrogenase
LHDHQTRFQKSDLDNNLLDKNRRMRSKRKFKVVLTDYEWPDLELEYEIFNKVEAEFVPAHCKSEEEVINLAKDADAVITEYAPITGHVIERLERCKIISMNAAGYDNVDLNAATDAGILLVNCPDYCYDEVADHTIALLLACARGVVRFDRRIQKGHWDFKSAGKLHRIKGSTFGVLGFGGVGRSVARKARVFGMETIAFDPYLDDEVFKREGVMRVAFETLLKESDFVSIHIPRTPETARLISRNEFNAMKNSAYIINTSRGSIIDEEALLNALEQGIIRGAALDVMENEPADFESRLFSCENLIITPHAGFYSEEAMVEVRMRAAQAVVRVLCEGKLPKSVVNRELVSTLSTRPFRFETG